MFYSFLLWIREGFRGYLLWWTHVCTEIWNRPHESPTSPQAEMVSQHAAYFKFVCFFLVKHLTWLASNVCINWPRKAPEDGDNYQMPLAFRGRASYVCHRVSQQHWIVTSAHRFHNAPKMNNAQRLISPCHNPISDRQIYVALTSNRGGGPGVVVSTAAFHARVRGSVPGLGGFKETKMFLPHPRVKVSIVGSLRDREVACSASDRQGSNFESCVWRTVSSHSSHHPQEVLLAQFSLYVHKGGLKPDSFHFYLQPLLSRWSLYG